MSKIKSMEFIESKPASIHVTCYAYGNMHSAVLTSWIDLANNLAQRKRYAALRTIREDALISRSRCRATQFFLKDDKDVWIQLDHDIQFAIEDIMAIADLAHQYQAAVCIPYSCRSFPPRPALRAKPDAEPLPENPRLKPVTYFASGCVAIPKQALLDALLVLQQEVTPEPFRITHCDDDMVGKFPTLWMPFAFKTDLGTEYLSEDYAASARLSLMEIPQLAYSPTYPLRHWGDIDYRLA